MADVHPGMIASLLQNTHITVGNFNTLLTLTTDCRKKNCATQGKHAKFTVEVEFEPVALQV